VSDVSILTATRIAVGAIVPIEWTNGATSCATAEGAEREPPRRQRDARGNVLCFNELVLGRGLLVPENEHRTRYENLVSPLESGGREGIRTPGLLVANEEKSKLRRAATIT
jgi:hypothetical protein